MYKFVECEALPRLAQMTELYLRLQKHNTVALQASRDQRQSSKELRDLSQEQRKFPEQRICPWPAGGVSSRDQDFTDPKWSGKSPEYTRRMIKHTSALLTARANYDAIYKALCEMQTFMAQSMHVLHEIRQADIRWCEEVYWINYVASYDLIKEAIATLASFSDEVGIELHDCQPILGFDESDQLSKFGSQYMNWFNSLPTLPQADAWPQRHERHLLIKTLAVADAADVSPNRWIELVPLQVKRGFKKVYDLLTQTGWILETGDHETRGSRPANTHAPYVRSDVRGEPKRKGLFRGR